MRPLHPDVLSQYHTKADCFNTSNQTPHLHFATKTLSINISPTACRFHFLSDKTTCTTPLENKYQTLPQRKASVWLQRENTELVFRGKSTFQEAGFQPSQKITCKYICLLPLQLFPCCITISAAGVSAWGDAWTSRGGLFVTWTM